MGEPVINGTDEQIRKHLNTLPNTRPGALVLLWSGHGKARGQQLWLQAKTGEVLATEVVSRCAESGAAQLLLLIDCCNAGQGLEDATRVASSLLAEYPPESKRVWFGIVVSCRAGDDARDGAFGSLLERLLTAGPRSPEMQRRWSHQNQWIFGDDLGAAIVEEWEDEDQIPQFRSQGRRFSMLPNPLWAPDTPEQVVEHLLLAARGEGDADEQSLFSGRVDEVDRVVEWVRDKNEGIRVVTGSAGTGKSTIIGRVAALSNPIERARLLRRGGWSHSDPGQCSVHAYVQARGLTARGVAELIDDQLTGGPDQTTAESGQLCPPELSPADGGRRGPTALVAELQHARAQGGKPPVIFVDSLDEARDEAFSIAEELLRRLAPFAVIVVTCRPLARNRTLPLLLDEPTQLQDDSTELLLDVLDPIAIMNLDLSAHQESQRTAIRAYAIRRLADRSVDMDANAVGDQLVERATTDQGSFLLTRILVDQLAASPINTSRPNWHEELADSIETAFNVDLAQVAAGDVNSPEDREPVQLARTMLTALTWGFGAGFPEDEWLAVAASLTGVLLNANHITWVLDQLGRYVVQDGEAGTAVYRVAHQSLADYLRPQYLGTAEQPFEPAAATVWSALAERYEGLVKDGYRADAPTYLWRYAHRHAAADGPNGITRLRSLASLDPGLLPSVAQADLEVAETFRRWGNLDDALASSEEAVRLFRHAAAVEPAFVAHLISALNNLGLNYRDVGRQSEALALAQQAVTAYRELAAGNPAYLPDLASALINLGIYFSELGRPHDALGPSVESVTYSRALVMRNPAELPRLATALMNLGVRYRELGRPQEALAPSAEAVAYFRTLVEADASHLPDLATALVNLGVRYRDLGRLGDAREASEEGIANLRDLVETNPAHVPRLAMALANLGPLYIELGRHADAVEPAEEAVTLRRQLATDNPAEIPRLASALLNLGALCSASQRPDDAVESTEEAIGLYRELTQSNTAQMPSLASALTNLGVYYGELDRLPDAVEPIEEAVSIYRRVIGQNPSVAAELATALTNLWSDYSQLGRVGEAFTVAHEVVILRRRLAAANPAHLPNLASALITLGLRYSELGGLGEAVVPLREGARYLQQLAATDLSQSPRLAMVWIKLRDLFTVLGRNADAQTATEAALAATEHAVDYLRSRPAADQANNSELATALANLGTLSRALGRPNEALSATTEAVGYLRELTAADPAQKPHLAGALANLGAFRSELGQSEALSAAKEAADLYLELVVDDLVHLRGLAAALSNLDRDVRAFEGDPSAVDELWDQAAEHIADPHARAELLIQRAWSAADGDHRAAAWLAQATEAATGDCDLMVNAHNAARHHRNAAPVNWDEAWIEVTGEPLPIWLTVDRDLLRAAREWIATPTYRAERDYLNANNELLNPSANTAVEEALLEKDEAEGERYREILSIARKDGVENAYRSLMRYALFEDFAAADTEEQQHMLRDHFDDLTHPSIRSWASEAANADDATPDAIQASLLVSLAALEDSAGTLEQVFAALREPELFDGILRNIASRPDVGTWLTPVSFIGITAAKSAESAGRASVYAAVGAEVAGDPDSAKQLTRQAIAAAPDERNDWIVLLADLAAATPEALAVIRYVAGSSGG
ncbi:tetratricopeptide repeat protein [Mycobacterium manitobense]|uniref:Tetratricopeptide repeat protein n=1 Tax=[Mycobacterium] manitobense TaxID=190147 RepID=A0A9X2YM40_9MYCO|nr:tetratricopeptide repeat protein [[Mycobacterium] manitobense]MCV7169077.1 tetratricopeptide repeat protein [[Mycobacterium] manitobense]